jgi:hypothetical protein
MSSSAGIRYGLQAAAAACVAAAYLLAGQWFILPALAVLELGCILFRRSSRAGASRWLLVGTTGLAAMGGVMGLSMVMIVVGVVAALGAWDLDDFEPTLQGCARPVDRVRLSRLHIKWLALALASGLLLALVGWMANLDLPFAAAAALAVIMIISLTRAAGILMSAERA